MIYAQHNFHQNLLSASGYKDSFMQKEIVIDELGRLISEQKKELIELMREFGVNVTVKTQNALLAEMVITQIRKKNSDFNSKLRDMITGMHKDIAPDFSADGEMETKFGEDFTKTQELTNEAIDDTFDRIATEKAKLTNGKTPVYNPTTEQVLKQRVATNDAKITSQDTGKTKNKLEELPIWVKYGLIAAAGVAVFSAAMYLYKKSKGLTLSSSVEGVSTSEMPITPMTTDATIQ